MLLMILLILNAFAYNVEFPFSTRRILSKKIIVLSLGNHWPESNQCLDQCNWTKTGQTLILKFCLHLLYKLGLSTSDNHEVNFHKLKH